MNEGCYKISMEEYQKDPCPAPSLSRSVIKDLLFQCPAKAKLNHPRLNPNIKRDDDKKFDIGTSAHAMFLEGEDVVEVIDASDWRTKAAKEARDKAYSSGKIPLLPDQYEEVKAMVQVAHSYLETVCVEGEPLNIRIADGEPELSYFWKDMNGIWCRIRVDWIHKGKKIILDYKTTGQSAYPENYVSIVMNTGLDIQDSFYRRGVNAVENERYDFFFLVQETEPPYLCSLIELDSMFKEMGREKVAKGMNMWSYCTTKNEWAGYSRHVYTLEPKPWAIAAWEMRKANG